LKTPLTSCETQLKTLVVAVETTVIVVAEVKTKLKTTGADAETTEVAGATMTAEVAGVTTIEAGADTTLKTMLLAGVAAMTLLAAGAEKMTMLLAGAVEMMKMLLADDAKKSQEAGTTTKMTLLAGGASETPIPDEMTEGAKMTTVGQEDAVTIEDAAKTTTKNALLRLLLAEA